MRARRGTASISETPTLRAYKILCKKSEDIGNYREAKRRARIRMYKKMHRFIEKEKGESLVRVRGAFFLATDNETLCQPNMYRIYTVPYSTKWQVS
ncbi:hypothetical protein COF84_19875 [Bacillus wiedmannii]|nr:hypothetical protein COF84_19875 [Bacillus wiedmannii]